MSGCLMLFHQDWKFLLSMPIYLWRFTISIHGTVTFFKPKGIEHIFHFNGTCQFFKGYFYLYRSHHCDKFCLVPNIIILYRAVSDFLVAECFDRLINFLKPNSVYISQYLHRCELQSVFIRNRGANFSKM